ncbi:hypothetical protein [Sorangium sp. So ce233]|uniref:hypothetical protein n=1 Tax=Sorangium sp. So ce233 TaxID=3133290 RepID=UPI003F634E9B
MQSLFDVDVREILGVLVLELPLDFLTPKVVTRLERGFSFLGSREISSPNGCVPSNGGESKISSTGLFA